MKKFLIAKLVSLMLMGTCYAAQKSNDISGVPACISTSTSHDGSGTQTTSPLSSQAREEVRGISGSCEEYGDYVQPYLGKIPNASVDALSVLWFASDGSRPIDKFAGLHQKKQRAVLRRVQSNEVDLDGTRIPDASEADISAKISRLAHAIARTEGFFVKGSLPNRLHNPGDIRSRLRHAYDGQTGLYHGYVVFRGDQFGWQALYQQIRKVLDDDSAFYNREMTFAQIAKVYATSPQWPKTLCKILQINPQLTFDEYFGLAPRVLFTRNYEEEMFVSRLLQQIPSSGVVWESFDSEISWNSIATDSQTVGMD